MVVKHSLWVFLLIVFVIFPSSLFRKEEEETRMATKVVERGFKLILGSQSMARKKILGEMGYDFTIVVNASGFDIKLVFSFHLDCNNWIFGNMYGMVLGGMKTADIDEKAIRRDNPQDLVVALAQAKADEIISKLGGHSQFAQDPRPTLLITADTVVVYKGIIREKPTSKEEARQFIEGYSGSHGGVVGSVIVSNLKTGVQRAGWDKAEVYFQEIPAKVIDDLVDDSITFKVAGGLTLEHPLISPFIDTVVGGVDTVMGLPKELTAKFITDVL